VSFGVERPLPPFGLLIDFFFAGLLSEISLSPDLPAWPPGIVGHGGPRVFEDFGVENRADIAGHVDLLLGESWLFAGLRHQIRLLKRQLVTLSAVFGQRDLGLLMQR